MDNKCPGGHVACSEKTSKDNTICVKTGETENCPITSMQFIEKAKEGEF